VEEAAVFQRVLVPLDGSEVSESALGYGVEIARRFEARLILLRAFAGEQESTRILAMMPADPAGGAIDPRSIEMVEESARAAQTEAQEYLKAKSDALTAEGLKVQTVMVDGSASDPVGGESRTRHARGNVHARTWRAVAAGLWEHGAGCIAQAPDTVAPRARL
jgi:nucleotide-binding universal stress UspA family protein